MHNVSIHEFAGSIMDILTGKFPLHKGHTVNFRCHRISQTCQTSHIVELTWYLMLHKVGAGDVELVEHLEIMHVRSMYIYVEYLALGVMGQSIHVKDQLQCTVEFFIQTFIGNFCPEYFFPIRHEPKPLCIEILLCISARLSA